MALPDTMQAWVCKFGQREPIRSQVPVPKPAPDGLLVRLLAMGVCHSDCSLLALDGPIAPHMKSEFILGHEGAGEIVQLGSEVTNFQIGDKVSIYIVPGCNECAECRRDMHTLCKKENSGNYGLGLDGFFAEYVACQARAAVKVPSGVDITAACLAPDAVLTSYQAVKYTAAVKPDQTIVIYGLGGVGLNGLQTALHLGAKRILVVDKRQNSIDEAIALGIPKEDTFCTSDPAAKPIHEILAEKGILVDTAIDFVGHSDTISSAQQTVRPLGLIVLVGLLAHQAPVMPFVMAMNMLTMKGHYNGSVTSLKECLDLMAEGKIEPKIETGSIEDLPKVLKDLDKGKVKNRMVLLPDWKK